MDAPTAARRRSPATIGLAAAFVALLVLAAVLAVRGRGALRLSDACGGHPIVYVGGAAQVCTFDDEFDEDGVDPAKWQVLSTPRIGFHTGLECFVDDGKHVAVRGGALALALSYSQPGGACRRLGLGYESGMVTTQRRFAQAYGRFTIRAALPAHAGVQPALWLYPRSLHYGRWPRSGEIDIAEAFGSAAQTWPHLHYLGVNGAQAHPGHRCPVAATDGFHTYSVDWTPTGFTFRYDGTTCMRITTWTPAAPLTAPAPFDRPFYILLELATGYGQNAPQPGMPVPQVMRVDYVRVWGRAAPP